MSSSADTSNIAAAPKLFSEYQSSAGIYDESQIAPGEPRAHWRGFVDALNRLGVEELALRWENGRRIIREHGITYNVYGDPQGMDRPWELDMIPFLVPPDEWERIQAGLVQRARLFNMLLADLHGPQRLLRDGVVPPALVFASPSFLRACHGIRPPKGIYLHLHAADLARSPDGQWWVLADRTQAPSGTGYALENRIVLSRILPDEFRDCHVQRLAAFFRAGRDTLRALAPANQANPNVVLLTPGPYNETYFEHAYLARYLGFTLVEGGDLTVRDCRVFLKTLEGLQPVDVILRRVDDTFCDPLELRSDSFLGVPGLVAAARAGHVCVANALGSGLLESPAFLAFLPSLCRRLLGEELKLPSVATWWCGQPRERDYVLDHLDSMVIKPAYGSVTRQPHFGEKLSATEKSKLIAAIRASPQDFVGQERVNLSCAPVWLNNRVESRRVVMRTFVAASGDGFTVMPGGLTRVSTTAEDPVVSMQSGAGSKDTWVQTDGPVMPVTLLTPTGQPVSVAPVAAELPSRVADNLYWLGRYAERLEDTLRLLRCVITRMVDEASGENAAEWAGVLQILANLRWLPPAVTRKNTVKELEPEILQLVYNPQRAGSVRGLVLRIRGIASIARDRFSADTWRILNQLQSDSRTRPGRIPMANALALLNTMIVDLAAFSGMMMENMTRGHGWRFLDFGRRLERAISLVTVVRAALTPPSEVESVLEPLLEIADSSITYRRRYFAQAQLGAVLDLLLLDEGNPRSLAFQLRALTEHAAQLPSDAHVAAGENEVKRLGNLSGLLHQTDLAALCRVRGTRNMRPLQQWLKRFDEEFEALSNALTGRYFSLTVARVS